MLHDISKGVGSRTRVARDSVKIAVNSVAINLPGVIMHVALPEDVLERAPSTLTGWVGATVILDKLGSLEAIRRPNAASNDPAEDARTLWR